MPILIVPMIQPTIQDKIGKGCGPIRFKLVTMPTTYPATIPKLIRMINENLPDRSKEFMTAADQVDLIDSLQGHIIDSSLTTPYYNDADENDPLENVIKNISGNNDFKTSNWKLQKKNKTLKKNETMNDVCRIARQISRDEQEWPPKKFSISSGRAFYWSDKVRGQLIAAYSYGNVPGNLIGGILTVKWGPRKTVFWTSLVTALVSLITPLIAQMHWGALIGCRVIVGIIGGVTFPACHTLVSKWAPPQEKLRFVWSLLGGTFGTIFTYPMVASIAANTTWEWGWYIPSMLMLFWLLIWAFCAYDSPAEHPGISNEEKEYILKSQANAVPQQKLTLKQIPILQICTSVPFISLVFCHFGNLFLIFIYQNTMMLYMTKVLGFGLTKSGLISSFPWIGRMLFGLGFSWIADKIIEKRITSITTLRKCATLFSHFIPVVMLLMAAYANCHEFLTNFYLFLALAFNGAATIASLSNNHDLSPNFAGVLYGIMNAAGSASGIIISSMVEEITTPHIKSIYQWQNLFWVGAIVCFLCMLIFLIGGSGKVQEWNEIKSESDVEANPKKPK
ncbi:sialin-like [Prorops nasuta]|uniref:sialin-like n=1 Tax=Prorops nasuta TaxID=863751 RepID=UPI0034D007E8